MNQGKFKLAIMTGSDTESTCRTIQCLAELREAEIGGILLDTERTSFRRRWRNLRRNIRREGVSYLWYRLGEAICEALEAWAARVISHGEVEKLLRDSFPERALSLEHVARMHGIPLFSVGSMNSEKAVETLQQLNADLGVVLGTRVLKSATFGAPRLGSINLHKGKVPEYRGQPAGFWEVYDGQDQAGVTVHFVDNGLDTGDVVGEACVPVHPKDSPESLRAKLDTAGSDLLARCVSELVRGTAERRPQPKSEHRARTSPTRRQRRMLQDRLEGSGSQPRKALHVFKTLYYLGIFYAGIYHLVRAFHRITPNRRGCILLYHRVNDSLQDPLTTGVKRFAEHLVTLRRFYAVVSTERLVSAAGKEDKLPASAVAIHFDDCYRDVYLNAARLLAGLHLPACAFISSGYIGTERVFPHDADKYPIHLENLNSHEVAGLAERGFEIGSHTVNHVDLGRVSLPEARNELTQSKRALESILGVRLDWISYPYGRKWNIRPEVVEIAKQAGYGAMFSAYGGYVNGRADLYNIQRVGMSGRHRPIDLLMEIEGLSVAAWKHRWSESQVSPVGAN
jgi:peptidoglycan/xylan/chitin deacetylase (PgdA/CDA1 family)/folate-dependent phosphoribosylglycinamide formyltransferase PurN